MDQDITGLLTNISISQPLVFYQINQEKEIPICLNYSQQNFLLLATQFIFNWYKIDSTTI